VPLPPHQVVDAVPVPADAGTTSGAGSYDQGAEITVVASPAPGFAFDRWTEGGREVSRLASYPFTTPVHRSLVAHFVPSAPVPKLEITRVGDVWILSWPAVSTDWQLQESASVSAAWTVSGLAAAIEGERKVVRLEVLADGRWFRLLHP